LHRPRAPLPPAARAAAGAVEAVEADVVVVVVREHDGPRTHDPEGEERKRKRGEAPLFL
jgi:hypothetical protein